MTSSSLTTRSGKPVSSLIIGGKEDLSQSEPDFVSAAFGEWCVYSNWHQNQINQNQTASGINAFYLNAHFWYTGERTQTAPEFVEGLRKLCATNRDDIFLITNGGFSDEEGPQRPAELMRKD